MTSVVVAPGFEPRQSGSLITRLRSITTTFSVIGVTSEPHHACLPFTLVKLPKNGKNTRDGRGKISCSVRVLTWTPDALKQSQSNSPVLTHGSKL